MATKRCRDCEKDKPVEEFSRHRTARDGRRGQCKDCRHAQQRALRARNPEKQRAHVAKWREKNQEKERSYRVKWNAENPDKRWLYKFADGCRERGVPLTDKAKTHVLELYDAPCYYCGADRSGKGQRHVDHVIPVAHGGQSTPENLVAACRRCNRDKAALTKESARRILEVIEWHLGEAAA